ncbi:MAG: NUDIX hydrolase [Chthoniobacterales bacterium]
MKDWKVMKTVQHFANEHLQVVTECACTPSQATTRPWTVVHRKPAVVIAAITREDELVLIRQERIPIQRAIWEVPAGQIDAACPTPAETKRVALRELREETGYELAPGGKCAALGQLFSSPGFTDECASLFVARLVRLSATGHAHEPSESILDCRSFPIHKVTAMIARGEIADANTLAVYARLVAGGIFQLS